MKVSSNQSSITYYKFDDKSSCIIASLPQRNDTQVIYIDQMMGTLLFSGIKGYDVFDNKELAYKFVSKDRNLVQCIDACSILGYVFSDKCCHLILIEKEKPLFPIFDKHMINAIENVIFIDIPTEIRCPQSALVNIESLKKYPFNRSHYFCPTLDLSKDFGSRTKVIRTCWNQKLMYPFKRFFSLIPNLCVSVFQGIASYTSFVEINIGILFMSSRLFPPLLPKTLRHHSVEGGVTCNEYTIDVYLIKNIENDFEVLNHTIQIGDFPFNWISDQYTNKCIVENPEECKKSTKTFVQRQKNLYNYDYVNFVNFMDKNSYESNLTESLNRALTEISIKQSTSIFIEQVEVEWIQSIKNTAILDDLVQNYWPTASSKIKRFGFTRSLVTNLENKQTSFNTSSKNSDPYKYDTQKYQIGISRFVFHSSFDREILGLFFYIMKLLEVMCLDEFGFNFPEKLVIPLQLKSFKYGFVYFTAKFLLEFNLYLSNFGNLPIGDLPELIYEYMNPQTVDFDTYKINFQSFFAASYILKNLPTPTIFAVTQSPSSFVMTKDIGNQILQPFNTNLIEIPLENQPLTICLSEHCYIKYLIIKNTNAVQLSIDGGYRLNRTIKIASKLILPWVPKNDHKTVDPYIFVDLESRAVVYDNEIKAHEYEKIRFLFLNFKTFKKDNLKIGSLYAYGSNKLPSLLRKKISPLQNSPLKGLSSDPLFNQTAKTDTDFYDQNLELQSSQTDNSLLDKEKEKIEPHPQISKPSQNSKNSLNSQSTQHLPSIQEPMPILTSTNIPRSAQNSPKTKPKSHKNDKNKSPNEKGHHNHHKHSDKTRVDLIIQNEINRIQKKEDYFEYQKKLIQKGTSLDFVDLEKILNPDKIEKEPRKTTCSCCQTKDFCIDCVSCKKPICKKCLRTISVNLKDLSYCSECLNKRSQYLLEVEKLKMLQFEAVKDEYPFISGHNDQMVNSKTKPLNYLNFQLPNSLEKVGDFAGFADINRPMLSTFAYEPPIPQKILTRLPECLFTSNVNWSFEANFSPLTIIFATECKIVAIHIACFSKLEVFIENATPNQFVFEPPGSIQKVELTGRMANMVLNGNRIDLRNIRFFGFPVFQKIERIKNSNLSLLPAKPRSLVKIPPLSCQFLKDLNIHEFAFNSSYKFVGIKFMSTYLLPSEVIIELRNDKTVEYAHHHVARIQHCSPDTQALGILLFSKPSVASKVKIIYPRLPQKLAISYATENPELLVLHEGKPVNK